MEEERERSIPRRQFVRSAVAIGGASALSACTEREGALLDDGGERTTTGDAPAFPRGDADAVPDAQHEWNEYLVRDSAGNTMPPQHQLVLGLRYEGSEPPTEAERERVRGAFGTLDRAFQWGTGGDAAATRRRRSTPR